MKTLATTFLLFLLSTYCLAQCPATDGSTLIDGIDDTFTINSACSAITISGGGTSIDQIIIQDGGSLTINVTGGALLLSSGSLDVNEGGNLTINVASNGFTLFNSTITVRGDGSATPTLDGLLTISSNGIVISNSSMTLQAGTTTNFSTNVNLGSALAASLDLDGDLNVTGDFTLGASGTITGSGSLDATGAINNNGGDDSGYSGPTSCGGAPCDPLPVELIHFSGDLSNNHISLKWTTASEINNEGFEIEWSSDGQEFSYVGFETGHGTSNKTHYYEHTIYNLGNSRKNYFRLKQFDYDGQYEYSPIISINNLLQNVVAVYPSTIDNHITLEGDSEVNYQAALIDYTGKSYYQTKGNTSLSNIQNELMSFISSLPPRIYIFILYDAAGSHEFKLIKK